ncbi:MAG: FliH/SctL family protein [Deltaproteobacteria bacterium]
MTSLARVIDFSAVPISIVIVPEIVAIEEEIPDTRVTHEEHEVGCEAAFRKGFQEANDLLAQQILEQRAEIAQLQDSVFVSLGKQVESINHQVSQMLPDLVIEITRRVLAGIEPDAETVRRIIAETLAEIAPGSTDVEIWLNPKDLALVESLDQALEQKFPGIKLSADPELIPGDCRAKSRFGAIDARIFTKLQNIARSLK